MPDNNIEREIEDILNRLDKFVPEESVGSRMRRRTPGPLGNLIRALFAPLTRISLGQVMLAAMALVFVGFVARRAGPIGTWILLAGVILFLTAFALSLVTRGGAPTEKQWRGRSLELRGPSLADRLKAWFKSRRRPR